MTRPWPRPSNSRPWPNPNCLKDLLTDSPPILTSPGGKVFALTGGLACGKSEVGRILAAAGVAVLDTDDVAHRCLAPDGPAYPGVVAEFGPGVLDDAGRIDRPRLAAVVFADPAARERLNQLVHPHVRAAYRTWIAERRRENRVAAVIIPLLFERGLEADWTQIVAVGAPEAVVRQRLRERGVPPEQIDPRLAAQAPVEEKLRRAHHAIRNDGSLAQLQQRTLAVLDDILMQQEHSHA